MERKIRSYGFPKKLFESFEKKASDNYKTVSQCLRDLMEMYVNNQIDDPSRFVRKGELDSINERIRLLEDK